MSSNADPKGRSQEAGASIGMREIVDAVEMASSYLSSHLSPWGKFDYVYEPWRIVQTRKYNLLRHAGTTLILYRLVGSRHRRNETREIAGRALSYLFAFSHVRADTNPIHMCIADDGVAKLGGTALALLALVARIDAQPLEHVTAEDMHILRAFTRHLISQQKADGSFACKYDISSGGEIPFKSVYYPGEALLSLCGAFRVTKDSEILESVLAGIRNLLADQCYDRSPEGAFDHWFVMALSELFLLTQDPILPEELEHRVLPLLGFDNGTRCQWPDQWTTAQIATRIEGLLSAARVFAHVGNKKRVEQIKKLVLSGLSRCFERQVKQGHTLYGDPHAFGGFTALGTTGSIRIDYVQHVLAASLDTIDFLKEGPSEQTRPHVLPVGCAQIGYDYNGAPTTNCHKTQQPIRSTPETTQIRRPCPTTGSDNSASQISNFLMEWSADKQVFGIGPRMYVHEGETKTEPSHDLAHLLVAACSTLNWLPLGNDEQIRTSEYNAVLLENILDQAYHVLAAPALETQLLDRVIRHVRWFVEQHYAPFPISAEEAFRKFCFGIEPQAVVCLCPYFFFQRKRELANPLRHNLSISFCLKDKPVVHGPALAFQQIVQRQFEYLRR